MFDYILSLGFFACMIGFFVWLYWDKNEVKKWPGVLKGIGAAFMFGLTGVGLFMLTGCSGKFNNGLSTFVGLEQTKKQSPQCEAGGPSDKITSNLGMRYHIYTSEDGKYTANGKYTHHSCAFSPDDKSYDAVGFELNYRVY